MRRGIRITVLVLLAYLLQSTFLSMLKIGGVVLDLISITLFTIGYACGPIAGLAAGALCSIIMEVLSGDLAGMVSFVCIMIGFMGGWMPKRIQTFEKAGMRGLERAVKRYSPMVLLFLMVLTKEGLYLMYFYLTGMDITIGHVTRVLWAGALAGLASLALIPFLSFLLVRRPDQTLVVKWWNKQVDKTKARQEKAAEKAKERERRQKKREEREKAREAETVIISTSSPEGGTDS